MQYKIQWSIFSFCPRPLSSYAEAAPDENFFLFLKFSVPVSAFRTSKRTPYTYLSTHTGTCNILFFLLGMFWEIIDIFIYKFSFSFLMIMSFPLYKYCDLWSASYRGILRCFQFFCSSAIANVIAFILVYCTVI